MNEEHLFGKMVPTVAQTLRNMFQTHDKAYFPKAVVYFFNLLDHLIKKIDSN